MISMKQTPAWPELRRNIDRGQARLSRFGILHQDLGKAFSDWVDRNFALQGKLVQENSAGWPGLSAQTLASRRRKGQGKKILLATGRLKRSIQARASEKGMELGTPVPYGAGHQLGLGVPKRPFLPSARQSISIAKPVVEGFIQGAIE